MAAERDFPRPIPHWTSGILGRNARIVRRIELNYAPPLFIVGAPRSGTTLLRNMLNRHPLLAICGETRFYHYLYARRQAFGDLGDLKNRRLLVEEYLSTERVQRLGMDLHQLGGRLLRQATGYRELFTSLLEYYAESQGKPRYGEKTPHHALITETLCEWFPGALIVHLVRDPRDVVASLQRMVWAPNSVVANAGIWLQCNLGARQSSHRPGYLLVHYEKLVAEPENELSRICALAGCDFTPAMLVPDTQIDSRRGLRAHQKSVNSERRGKWQDELTSGDVALIEWAIGPALQAFGYQPAGRTPSRLKIASAAAFAALDAVRKQLVEFPGVWYYLMQPTQIAKEEYWKHRRDWQREEVPFSTRWRLTQDTNSR